jgi:hypothetical protein
VWQSGFFKILRGTDGQGLPEEIVRKAVKALIRGESGDGWKATHGMFSCSEFAILGQLYDKSFPTTQPQFRA